MPRFLLFLLAGLVCAQDAKIDLVASQPEDYKIYTEHPRLLINSRRLRLLRRERERKTIRWEQFNTIIAGKADLPERGFALALYYAASEDAAIGKQAVDGPVQRLLEEVGGGRVPAVGAVHHGGGRSEAGGGPSPSI